MIGVILAAGMAKRLRPLTDTRPKCLLQVGERTLLQRTVDALLQAGISELVVVTGYRGNMLRDFLQQHYPQLTIHFIDNVDYEHNNNIFSLWLTRPYTDGRDFLLMDSDILFDPAIVRRMLAEGGTALALNRHELGEEDSRQRLYTDLAAMPCRQNLLKKYMQQRDGHRTTRLLCILRIWSIFLIYAGKSRRQ